MVDVYKRQDMDNQPFRDNGKRLVRPGGHGALIENLKDLDADIIFIKNIDNVVPDRCLLYTSPITDCNLCCSESMAYRERESGQ